MDIWRFRGFPSRESTPDSWEMQPGAFSFFCLGIATRIVTMLLRLVTWISAKMDGDSNV